jgi:hypothetical protein
MQLATHKGLGIRAKAALPGAAYRHVSDAVALRWWGKVEPGKNCVPIETKPELCDPHINPQTKSTPMSRAEAAGYPHGCTKGWSVAENAYTAYVANVTPRAAFDWWMQSPGHMANIMSFHKEMTVQVAWGSADPAAGSQVPAVTYVQMFGTCKR